MHIYEKYTHTYEYMHIFVYKHVYNNIIRFVSKESTRYGFDIQKNSNDISEREVNPIYNVYY